MSQFEFFMGFYGLLLGIGMAELLLGFGKLIRARKRPRIGLLTPTLGAVVFLQIITSLIDAWLRLQHLHIDLVDMAIPIVIGIAYFLSAVTVVPDDHGEWQNLDDYFFARRNWTLGPIIVVFLLTLALEIPNTARMIESARWDSFARYATLNMVGLLSLAFAWRSKNPRVVLAALVALLGVLIYAYAYVIRTYSQS